MSNAHITGTSSSPQQQPLPTAEYKPQSRSAAKTRTTLYRRRIAMYRRYYKTLPKDKPIQYLNISKELYKSREGNAFSIDCNMVIDTETADTNFDRIEIDDNVQEDKSKTQRIGTVTQVIDYSDQWQSVNNGDPSAVQAFADENNLFHSSHVSDARDNVEYNLYDESSDDDSDRSGYKSDEIESDFISTCGNESDTSLDDTDNNGNMFSIDSIKKSTQVMRVKNWVSTIYLIASCIAISLRGKLTYAATILMLKNLNSMIVNSGVPRTLKGLWAILSRNNKAATTRHLYCRSCLRSVGEGEEPTRNSTCQKCGVNERDKSLGYFVQVKVGPQLEQLFSDPYFVNSAKYRHTRSRKNKNAMEDIYDGEKYKEKCRPGGFLNNDDNFSFSIFTDGCQVSKSSRASAWPILLQINDLSPQARKRYIILAGIWIDTIHPDLNVLLMPTILELQDLYFNGITWKNPANDTVITSRFVTLVCVADTVARAAILNMTMFNGLYGCTFCYAKGQHLPGRGVKRSFPIENVASCRRTDNEIRECMIKAHESRVKELVKNRGKFFGVKEFSAMALLPEFDLSFGMVVESVHNVYLGVVKLHTELLLYEKATDVWYAGNPGNIANINSRLLGIRPPSRIARKPRSVEEMKKWKASEWRNWINFYALPCLEGIIRESDLQHLSLLSRASWIMNKDCISTDELEEARSVLQQYVKKFEDMFGIENMRYNIHLLTHLVDTVQNWGPFWAHSAFPFESCVNGAPF